MAMVVALLAGAVPASAAAFVSLSVSNGTVGVAQPVIATVDSSAIGFPAGTVTFTANGTTFGSQPVGGSLGNTATVSWTPTAAGAPAIVAAFAASDGSDQATATKTVTVSRVDTVTTITTPGTAATNTAVTLSALVRSRDGSYVPTGGISFFRSDGQSLGSANVDATGKATLAYTTPSTVGTVSMYAVYNGDASANASPRSATDSIKVSTQASSVSLVVPQVNYANAPVVLTAKITPTTATGTVDFYVNTTYLGTGRVSSAAATLTWVPSALGTFTLTARYSGGNGASAGTATNKVTVTLPLKADSISLVPGGSSAPWQPNSTISLPNGANVTFAVSTTSSLPVTLTATGPCQVVGANGLHIQGAGSPCALTAATAGGNGYSPVSQKYTIITGSGTQTASVAAPASGTYAKGSRLKLAKTSKVTNLNQPITWRVTKGGSHCRVVVSGSYYKLKLVKRGSCKVTGSAPAIPGQWSAFTTKRSYTVR
jgi:hypothetical protein